MEPFEAADPAVWNASIAKERMEKPMQELRTFWQRRNPAIFDLACRASLEAAVEAGELEWPRLAYWLHVARMGRLVGVEFERRVSTMADILALAAGEEIWLAAGGSSSANLC
jgi:hypothetical protein